MSYDQLTFVHEGPYQPLPRVEDLLEQKKSPKRGLKGLVGKVIAASALTIAGFLGGYALNKPDVQEVHVHLAPRARHEVVEVNARLPPVKMVEERQEDPLVNPEPIEVGAAQLATEVPLTRDPTLNSYVDTDYRDDWTVQGKLFFPVSDAAVDQIGSKALAFAYRNPQFAERVLRFVDDEYYDQVYAFVSDGVQEYGDAFALARWFRLYDDERICDIFDERVRSVMYGPQNERKSWRLVHELYQPVSEARTVDFTIALSEYRQNARIQESLLTSAVSQETLEVLVWRAATYAGATLTEQMYAEMANSLQYLFRSPIDPGQSNTTTERRFVSAQRIRDHTQERISLLHEYVARVCERAGVDAELVGKHITDLQESVPLPDDPFRPKIPVPRFGVGDD